MNLTKLPELNENQIKLLTLINIRWVTIDIVTNCPIIATQRILIKVKSFI